MTAQKSSRDLRRIRDAYRETVMAVPHYEREYGESIRENLAAEFGTTLAGHLADSDVLTPAVYETFLDACKRGRDERGRLLRTIEREQESLQRWETELTAIEVAAHDAAEGITATTGSRTLSRIDRRLETLEARCMECARARQELLHEHSGREFQGTDGFGFMEYLYTDMDTTTPVLSDAGACLETIRHHRRRCLQ
ncbi:DUF7260 family protein [Halorhabdus rudnickae]|uniref:DUF7260 family protein n=1 Tax=Halorhabdus rudnickae TaxID=1775544 RepID=UPI00108252BB|nr:hypothetical protein [Halorhabdus rudnickae]